ncbi:MAG: putative lipid II flippase FtsW [Betaproteobacteria bacterium]|nr:putative lipid II flippase FtsW [Betaproteobacteria bacterium]
MLDIAGASARRMMNFDQSLLWASLLLLALGLVMVYSASIAMAEASRSTGYRAGYFLLRHAAFVGIGLVAAVLVFQIPLRWWQAAAPYLFVFCAVLLMLVLVPGVGRVVNGSRRWLSLFFFNLQPSELMKLAVVLYTASYAVRKAAVLHGEQPMRDSIVKGFLPLFAVMVAVGGLLLMEPDFGALVVIFVIAFGMLFLGGLDLRLFIMLAGMLPLAMGALIVIAPYRLQRFMGFLDPWSDPFDKGYQLSHALIAFGRGELFGVGLGASVEKLMYLPEAHTDFLLAVIAEELGLFGVILVLALFAWVVARGFMIGRQAARLDRPFTALVAQGMAIWLAVQALINMGVNMGVLPTKGLTLPLLSFGGSAMVSTCIGLAILLRADYENRLLLRGYSA